MHGWKVGYFSPENYPVRYHYSKLAEKITGLPFKEGNIEDYTELFHHIENNYFFIYPENDMSYENIIEKARYLVKKKGIKVVVIDPYNKIEHLRDRGESETEYISKFLDKLTTFGKTYDILTVLVAHPRKMEKNGKLYAVPNLYDINGSANFYNKCDYGLSIYRMFETNSVQIHVLKVKFKHLGESGMVEFRYNYNNGRLEAMDVNIDQWSKEGLQNYYEPERILPTNIEAF
jgi:twinkle protein